MSIIVACEICGKESKVKPFLAKTKKFCSLPCKHKAQSERFSGSNSATFGIKRSKDFCERIKQSALTRVGERAGNWQGGLTLIPERRSWVKNKRNRQKRANGGFHSFEEWEDLKNKYNHSCLKCLRKEPEIKLQQDHIIPVSKFGSDDISNIQPLCQRCNLWKMDKEIDFRTTYSF